MLAAAPISSSLGMHAEWQGMQKKKQGCSSPSRVVVTDMRKDAYMVVRTTLANTGVDDRFLMGPKGPF